MISTETQSNAASTVSSVEQSPRQGICANIIYQCAHHILLIIYRFFSDCLLCRIISFVFTLQAGIMWLGCKYESDRCTLIVLGNDILVAVNFILQLLFLPFGQHRLRTLIGSYLMIPGTVAL